MLWGGNPRKIIQQAEWEQITLYLSLSLFQELKEALNYPKLQVRLQALGIAVNQLLLGVRQITQFCQPISLSEVPELRDPKDKIILEAALSVPVDVIISGDGDLLVLGEFQQIPIVTVSDFLELYEYEV